MYDDTNASTHTQVHMHADATEQVSGHSERVVHELQDLHMIMQRDVRENESAVYRQRQS